MEHLKRTFTRWGVVLAILAGLVLAMQSPADAVSVRLTDTIGGTIVLCNDGDAVSLLCPTGDLDPTAGVVLFAGPVGAVWTINVAAGFSPFGAALLDLLSANTSLGAGTLTVEASETGFASPPGPTVPLSFGAGGTAGGSVTFDAYIDDSDALFGQGALLGTLGPFGAGAFSGSMNVSGTATPPYSLTIFATLVHFGVAGTSFDADLVPKVSEPSVLWLLGIGLMGSGFVGRRRLPLVVRS